MDDHICLQVIDEPTIKDIDPLTGEETIEDDNSDLQNFLKTWEKVDMNPDKLNKEEESFEFQQRRCYSEARQHFASANEEFRFMSIILENVISESHLGREYAEVSTRELNNPDVPLGASVIDKQLQLQSSSKFFIESANEMRAEVTKYKNYFRNLDELSKRFPIGFYFDYGRIPIVAAVIPPEPIFYEIPWIVLQPDENGDIYWRLSTPISFYINQKNVFFDCESPYSCLTSRVMLQYLFHVIRFEMISLSIDYSITPTTNKISYSAQNSINVELEVSSEKKLKKKSDLCPPYLPSLVSQCMEINPHPFKKFKEIIDERALIKNAVDIVFARFLSSDFCNVIYKQKKRTVVIQITPYFGFIPTEFKNIIKNPHNFLNNNNEQKNNTEDSKKKLQIEPSIIHSYNITCFLGKNHFCATDPQSQYSYINIDLRSRTANNSLTKWCESHYFRMFELTVAAVASRFGFISKMNEQQITVKCDHPRKIKFYTTGRGDLDVIVIIGNDKWKTKWANLPRNGTREKIEYLFFFNFTNI